MEESIRARSLLQEKITEMTTKGLSENNGDVYCGIITIWTYILQQAFVAMLDTYAA